MDNEKENLLINPKDIEQPTRRRKGSMQLIPADESEINQNEQKIIKRNGDLKIDYSTNGRFSTPATLYWKDYTVEDINSLALTNQDDILENLVTILNTLKNDENCRVEDMLYEEFLETLICMKSKFNTSLHTHYWMCKCQSEYPEKDKEPSKTEIDLKSLNFKHIEEADEMLRVYYKGIFDEWDQKQFEDYLYIRYKDNPLQDIKNWTKEKELETIQIKEPVDLPINDHIYTFNFSRLGDVIEGYKKAIKKFQGKIKEIDRKRNDKNIPLAEFKMQKEEEKERIKKEIAKTAILYSRALSLIEKDGQELTFEQRIEEWREFSRKGMLSMNDYFDMIVFGLNDKRDLTCNLCGDTTRGFLLQQSFNLIELLPLESNTDGKRGKCPKLNIFVRA